jgi:pimeloyl-ACP methyl ester carboxylesterase
MDAKASAKPLQERLFDLKAATLRYLVREGEGPTLVLVHGFGGAGSNWDALVPHLDPRRRLIVPDLPGHGRSSPLPALPSLGPFADRLALLLDREDAWPAVAVGHSMGGLVVLRLARHRPDGVAALVLAAAAGVNSATERARVYLTVDALVRPGRLISGRRGAVAQSARLRTAVFGHWGAADPPALSPEAVEGLLAGSALHTDLRSVVPALVLDDPRRDLERVRCPTLLLWGAQDHQTPVSDAFDYARRLRAELRVIPDCGHLLIAERPDACAHALHEVAERVVAAPPAAAA